LDLISVGIEAVSDSWAPGALFEVIATCDTQLEFQHAFGAKLIQNQLNKALRFNVAKRSVNCSIEKYPCFDLNVGLLANYRWPETRSSQFIMAPLKVEREDSYEELLSSPY
jgi:hypothetical protein